MFVKGAPVIRENNIYEIVINYFSGIFNLKGLFLALEQLNKSLNCDFSDKYICGWTSNYAREALQTNPNDDIISDWTRVQIGVGSKYKNGMTCEITQQTINSFFWSHRHISYYVFVMRKHRYKTNGLPFNQFNSVEYNQLCRNNAIQYFISRCSILYVRGWNQPRRYCTSHQYARSLRGRSHLCEREIRLYVLPTHDQVHSTGRYGHTCAIINHVWRNMYVRYRVLISLQLVVIGLDTTLNIDLTGLNERRQHTCQFGLPRGRYRIEWYYKIIQGYAFIREVSYTSGVCEYAGQYGTICHWKI